MATHLNAEKKVNLLHLIFAFHPDPQPAEGRQQPPERGEPLPYQSHIKAVR